MYVSNIVVMPWTRLEYPVSMRSLTPTVRAKAIEIANALMKENIEIQTAVVTAINRARDWAANNFKDSENNYSGVSENPLKFFK